MRRCLLLLSLAAAGCGSHSLSDYDFSPPHDLAVPIDLSGQAGQPCNAYRQSGCGEGLHCTVGILYNHDMGSDAPADVCIKNPPRAVPEGGACRPIDFLGYGGDLCEPGTACMAYGGFHKCRKLCFHHSDCDDNATCIAFSGSPDSVKDQFGDDIPLSGCVRSDVCNPVAQSGCPIPGQACYFSGADDYGRSTLCEIQLGNVSPNKDCTASRQCGAGEICAGLGFCRRLCYMTPVPVDGGVLGACPHGEGKCNPFFGSLGIFGLCE